MTDDAIIQNTLQAVRGRLATRRDVVLLSLLFFGFLGLYFDIFRGLIQDWSENDNYSHGFFIPFISIYMIYTLRDDFMSLHVRPVTGGLIVLLAGLGQLLLATTGSEFFLQRTSMIPVLLGTVLFCLGMEHAKKIFVPICYLIFMIPLPAILWNKIAFPMQLFSTALTEKVVRALGIPVYRSGNILHLTETTLEVVDACSGLRSLMTMFALSAALAWFSDLSLLKKWILFFMAAPVAICANIIRLTVTSVLSSRYGAAMAQGFLHEFSGFVTFFLGLAMLMGIYKVLVKIND